MGGGETVEWTKPCCAVFWYTGSRRPHAPGARSWRPARTGPHPASKIARWLRLGACRSPLSGKLGRDGKEPLMDGARGLIVVNKFAPTVPQLHDRHGWDRGTARATLGQGLAVSAFPPYVPV